MISSKLGFGRKLRMGIILIMVVIVLVSVMTVQNLNSSREDLLEIVEDRFKKVNYAYTIEKNVILSKMMVGMISNDVSADTSDSVQAKLAEYHVRIEEKFIHLNKLTLTEEAKKRLSECATLYRIYKENEHMAIVEITKETKDAEERWDKLEKTNSDLLESIEEFISYQENRMEEALNRANEKYDHLCLVVVLLTITSCGLIGLIGYWVVRSTTKDLKQITTVLEEIDLNDPSTLHRLEVKTNDEIGLIAEAFNNMSMSLEIYKDRY